MTTTQENTEAVNALAQQIASAIMYAESGYDRTFLSIVKAINEDGSYQVPDEYGTVRDLGCAIPSLTITVGTQVYVNIPQNNLNKMYISGIVPKFSKR